MLELATITLGSLPRRLHGHKADFPSGFLGVARASERLSAWKWAGSGSEEIVLPGQD